MLRRTTNASNASTGPAWAPACESGLTGNQSTRITPHIAPHVAPHVATSEPQGASGTATPGAASFTASFTASSGVGLTDDAPTWTEAQAESWRRWLRARCEQMGYIRAGWVAMQALAVSSGLTSEQWQGYLDTGMQPNHQRIGAIARTLGAHPLAVAYHAGLLTQGELAAALMTDRLPNPLELQSALEQLDAAQTVFYSASQGVGWMRDIAAMLRQTLDYVSWLAQAFDLRAQDFGAAAASRLRIETAPPSVSGSYHAYPPTYSGYDLTVVAPELPPSFEPPTPPPATTTPEMRAQDALAAAPRFEPVRNVPVTLTSEAYDPTDDFGVADDEHAFLTDNLADDEWMSEDPTDSGMDSGSTGEIPAVNTHGV